MSAPRARRVSGSRIRPAPLRVAFLVRGLDGLFLRPPERVTLYALVPAGSPLEDFARRILPEAQVLSFRLKQPLGPYPSTEQILRQSDVAAVLRRHRIPALFLSAACSEGTFAWSQQHRIALLMTEYAEQRRLEDKVWFDRFLQRLDLPSPAGGSFRLGQDPLPRRGKAVLQIADSMGGEGTFFINGASDITALAESGILHAGQRYLLRRFIPGRPYGITVFVGERDILLSALRLQCYYPAPAGSSRRSFAGIQWVASDELSTRLRRRINQTFLALGRALHRRRALGFANVDFMVDGQDRIFILECNARMSAATPQLLAHPELISGQDVGTHFLRRFHDPERCARAPNEWPLPPSNFAGATLDLIVPSKSESARRGTAGPRLFRAYRSGRYQARDHGFSFAGPSVSPPLGSDEIALFFFGARGQVCEEDDTLGTVLSTAPLYDAEGNFLARAQQVLAYFRPTRPAIGSSRKADHE